MKRYFKLALDNAKNPVTNLIAEHFDIEYLSESDHIDTWKDMLTSPQHHLNKPGCVGRALNEEEEFFLDENAMISNMTAGGNCIHHKRICARLVNFRKSIKLVFFPLPFELRGVDEPEDSGYWMLL